jgi:hypothetical protein
MICLKIQPVGAACPAQTAAFVVWETRRRRPAGAHMTTGHTDTKSAKNRQRATTKTKTTTQTPNGTPQQRGDGQPIRSPQYLRLVS